MLDYKIMKELIWKHMKDLKSEDILGVWINEENPQIVLSIGKDTLSYRYPETSQMIVEAIRMVYISDMPSNTFQLSDRIILFMKSNDDNEIKFKIDGNSITFIRK